MTSVKRVSDLEASTESPLKKPRDSLDTVEPSVDLEGP
jgi:SWI/SNF-related matrix-associated actin-dependent regulator of chromatin subfamily A3